MAAKKVSKKVSSPNYQGSLADYKKSVSSNNSNSAAEIAKTVAYEVSGAGDLMRFVRNPSLKTAASLGVTIGAYALGPAAKAAQAAKVANAVRAVNATADVRAANAAIQAAKTSRVVKATKGAGVVTTKAGTKLPMTGIKSFSTAKNPARAAASTRVVVGKEAQAAGASAAASMQKVVTGGKIAGASVASAKAGSTVSTQKQKKARKNVR